MASSDSKLATPLLVTSAGVAKLQRAGMARSSVPTTHREEFIQTLVHDHPDVIPMLDIEPAFTPLVSVCRELETPAGYLDNLWITPEGGVVLGECKLVRNSQARREVVAQALDYARAVSSWGFDELERAAGSARGRQTSGCGVSSRSSRSSTKPSFTMRSNAGWRRGTLWCSSSATASEREPRR